MRFPNPRSSIRSPLASLWFAAALAALATVPARSATGPAEESSAVAPDQLYRLDMLPRLRAGIKVAPISSFDPQAKEAWRPTVDRVGALLDRTGSDVSSEVAPPGAELHTMEVGRSLAPGKSVTLFQAHRGGRIVGLRLGPASVLAGKE